MANREHKGTDRRNQMPKVCDYKFKVKASTWIVWSKNVQGGKRKLSIRIILTRPLPSLGWGEGEVR